MTAPTTTEVAQRWTLPRRPPAREIGFAAALCLVDLAIFSGVISGILSGEFDPVSILVAVLGFVPLAWRTLAPVPVFFAVWISTLATAVLFDGLRPTLGLIVALYSVASRSTLRTSVLAVVASVPTAVAVALKNEIPQNPPDDRVAVSLGVGLLVALLTVASWAFGRWVGASRRRLVDLEERRRRAADEARVEERRQIALELHDILSHSVSVMVLQADGARALLSSDSARADAALGRISQVGRESVGELRRLLGILVDGSIEHGAGRGGQPGLADIPQLVKEATETGLLVHVETSGHPPTALPASFERSVYRIVKECLVNSGKHGGAGTSVTVRSFWGETVLIVEVVDDGGGKGDPSLSTGHGLAGLRERVRALEGRLEAGPAGTGFAVTTTLPIPPASHVVGAAPEPVETPA